ncbi:hypothetical protein [Pantoea agglomerans]|uniref:RipA family octameric membrane protein n=1 Tax=Enterobacter agglomerans TaxID=549 RepID=UPI003BA00EE0
MNLIEFLFPSEKVDKDSPNSRFDDDDVQLYFTKHSVNTYVKKLLNCRSKEFLSNSDMVKLKEAYDKAHDIRKFEIELYWKRTTYIWTLIAALITICGVMITAYYRLEDKPDRSLAVLLGIDSLAFFGCVITIISSNILKSGEYWQKNWEYHVNMLEPFFSGSLYSTHLHTYEARRYSIATLNYYFYIVVQVLWLVLMAFTTSCLTMNSQGIVFAISFCAIGAVILFISTIINKITSSEDKNSKLIISQSTAEISSIQTLAEENPPSKLKTIRSFIFENPLVNFFLVITILLFLLEIYLLLIKYF